MAAVLHLVDNRSMEEQIRDMVVALKTDVGWVVKSMQDHLVKWDNQWLVLDGIKERLIAIETIQRNVEKNDNKISELEDKIILLEKKVENINTEKGTFGSVIKWIIAISGMLVGVWGLWEKIKK